MKKTLIMDTNLLLLWAIGATNEGRYIKKSKRLKYFDEKDYQLLLTLVGNFDKVAITPYIATEFSNLIDLDEEGKSLIHKVANNLFEMFEVISVDIKEDFKLIQTEHFGITDASLIKLANSYYVLSNDLRLTTYMYSLSNNINHILPYNYLKAGSLIIEEMLI